MGEKDNQEYQNRLHEARGILDEALEKALDCFPKDELDDARLALANYVVGYMAVGFGLTIHKSN